MGNIIVEIAVLVNIVEFLKELCHSREKCQSPTG